MSQNKKLEQPTGDKVSLCLLNQRVYPRSRVIAYVIPTRRYARSTRLAGRGSLSEPGIESPITTLLMAVTAETDSVEARASKRETMRLAHSVRSVHSVRPVHAVRTT